MKDKKVKIKFDSFECNLLINGIFEWRNMLLEQDIPTEDVGICCWNRISPRRTWTNCC